MWTPQGACPFLISAPQGAALQVRGISVLIPYHHAEGASSSSGDSNSTHHSPALKVEDEVEGVTLCSMW